MRDPADRCPDRPSAPGSVILVFHSPRRIALASARQMAVDLDLGAIDGGVAAVEVEVKAAGERDLLLQFFQSMWNAAAEHQTRVRQLYFGADFVAPQRVRLQLGDVRGGQIPAVLQKGTYAWAPPARNPFGGRRIDHGVLGGLVGEPTFGSVP
jgi:hypothetical protein